MSTNRRGRPPGSTKDKTAEGQLRELIADSVKIMKTVRGMVEGQLKEVEKTIASSSKIADRLSLVTSCTECYKVIGDTTKQLIAALKTLDGASSEDEDEISMEEAIAQLKEKHS